MTATIQILTMSAILGSDVWTSRSRTRPQGCSIHEVVLRMKGTAVSTFLFSDHFRFSSPVPPFYSGFTSPARSGRFRCRFLLQGWDESSCFWQSKAFSRSSGKKASKTWHLRDKREANSRHYEQARWRAALKKESKDEDLWKAS